MFGIFERIPVIESQKIGVSEVFNEFQLFSDNIRTDNACFWSHRKGGRSIEEQVDSDDTDGEDDNAYHELNDSEPAMRSLMLMG